MTLDELIDKLTALRSGGAAGACTVRAVITPEPRGSEDYIFDVEDARRDEYVVFLDVE